MPTYDIIIPHYGVTPDIEQKALRCLETIRSFSADQDYRVIFVVNGTDLSSDMVAMLESMPSQIIRNRVNQGFIRATNQGIAFSSAPYVVLMNNDTEAAPNWLTLLRQPLDDPEKRIGLSGPRTNTTRGWQGRWAGRGQWIQLRAGSMLAFFCVMIRRAVIEELGPLDEDFGPGLGDDDMYCWMAERHGWNMALVQNLVIPHHHRTTFHEVYGAETTSQMQQDALARYHDKRRKWNTEHPQ